MKSLRDFGISRRFNDEDKNQERSRLNYDRVTTTDYNDYGRQINPVNINNTSAQRLSSFSNRPSYYTAPARDYEYSSTYVQPFRQQLDQSRRSMTYQPERYLESDYKKQIQIFNSKNTISMLGDLATLAVLVVIPWVFLISWSLGFVLFFLGASTIFFKQSSFVYQIDLKINVPFTLQVIVSFISIATVMNLFISQDPSYDSISIALFVIPSTVYIIATKWEDLFISKIPIDSWVYNRLDQNKWMIKRFYDSLISTFKPFLKWELAAVCVSANIITGMYDVFLNGLPFQNLSRNFWSNIFNKIVMLISIFYTIQLSNTIETFVKTSSLSSLYKDLPLYLWIFKVKKFNDNKRISFRAVKHFNQILTAQRDLMQKELPIKSRQQQQYSDTFYNFANAYLQEIVTNDIAQQKTTSRSASALKSTEGILDDLTIYFKKINSFIDLGFQSIRVRQQLQAVAGICNILVKGKAYQKDYRGTSFVNQEILNKLKETHRAFEIILQQNIFQQQKSSRKLIQYINNTICFLSGKTTNDSTSRRESSIREGERVFKLFG